MFVRSCLFLNKEEPLLCVYLQCDGTRSICRSMPRRVVRAKQTPSLQLLCVDVRAERRDNWSFQRTSIIITQSIIMSCLIICIKIYCASDISRLRKIYISQQNIVYYVSWGSKGMKYEKDIRCGTTRKYTGREAMTEHDYQD